MKQFAERLDDWVDAVGAVQSADDLEGLSRVNAMYRDKAVLSPTIENKARGGSEDRIAYFKEFAPNVVGALWARPEIYVDEEADEVTFCGDYFFKKKEGGIAAAEFTFKFRLSLGDKIHSHTSRIHPQGEMTEISMLEDADCEIVYKEKLVDFFSDHKK